MTYEKDILPRLVEHLDGEDLGRPGTFFNLYLIGRTREKARAKVVICCEDIALLAQMEQSVRASKLFKQPAFGMFDFGVSSLPLEA